MACTTSTPKLTEDQISDGLSRIDGWSLTGNWIEKKFEFKNFLRAMSFVNGVAYLAESINHHPDILIHYNEVTLRCWTHTAGGVTEYDFELARKIEALLDAR
jgi:4a-hydroxytetrahydrobiopterin dehydratase